MISDVNPTFLDSGGLKDLSGARPGAGYTGHSFNDFNHCDLTTMLGKPDVQQKKNINILKRIDHVLSGEDCNLINH